MKKWADEKLKFNNFEPLALNLIPTKFNEI